MVRLIRFALKDPDTAERKEARAPLEEPKLAVAAGIKNFAFGSILCIQGAADSCPELGKADQTSGKSGHRNAEPASGGNPTSDINSQDGHWQDCTMNAHCRAVVSR